MVENYTKDIKESVYHGAVISVLAVGCTMLGKTLIKMSPPSLSKAWFPYSLCGSLMVFMGR